MPSYGSRRCKTTPHHKTMEKSVKNTHKVDSFFTSTASDEINNSVIRAEVMRTNFIVQHNLSFLTADHLAPVYSKMFPDSEIAKKFRCARTKTIAIINNAIRSALHESLVTYMQNRLFSICNDGSSDSGIKKINPVCVNIFDADNSSEVQTKFYDMCVTTGVDCSKSETLFNAIIDKFVKDEIPWQNVISVGLDNRSANMGIRSYAKSRILQKYPDCLIVGCNCHLAHLTATKGGGAYHIKTGFDIETHQVDLYYFFKKSTRRKGILANYTEFVGCEKWEEITRYVSTRWLPLEQCCDRQTKRFKALKSMFLSDDEKDSTKRFKRLSNDFGDPLTEVHVAFFTAALPIFANYNKFLKGMTLFYTRFYP